MLVIIEGADGSGKTSLATRIRKDIDQYVLFLRSNGPPTIAQLADVIGWIGNLPPRLTLVSDRFVLISEYIYGPILRGKCIHGLSLVQMAKWLSKDIMIIHCRPNYEALAAGMRQDVQMTGVAVNFERIVQDYDDLMTRLEANGVYIKRYDYTGPPQLILDSIRTFIRGKNNGD